MFRLGVERVERVPSEPNPPAGRIRFGEFEVDLRSHELLRAGRRTRLQEKSFLVLQELLKSPGELVTREALAGALWPKDHFVDAEHGLNTAVRRLRETLGDSAGQARYIETLPRLGYRFLAAVEVAGESGSGPEGSSTEEAAIEMEPEIPRGSSRRRRLGLALVLVGSAIAILAALLARSREVVLEAPEPPGSVADLLARSRYLRNVKRLPEAKQFVEEALALEPANPEALGGLALSLLGEGRNEEARQAARRAIELDPGAWEAHRALAVLARSVGDMNGVERELRAALVAEPSDYKTRNRLARHLLECGRLEEARPLIVENRRVAPDDPDVQNIWIELALRAGDYEDAIRQGEIWMTIWAPQVAGPPTPTVRDLLGLAYVGARRFDDALAQFRAVDADDDLREALALGHAGRTAEARAILDRHTAGAAETGPGTAGAIAMAAALAGDLDLAFAGIDRQIAARWFPGWVHCALFEPIRRDARWPDVGRRLEREFFSGVEGPALPVRTTLLMQWPRSARAAAAPARD